MNQEEGLLGRFVGGMIRRTVRARFRNVYWNPPETAPKPPVVFVPNHHGWHDGYLMFLLVTRLGIRCLDWIQEYEAFPWFRYVGGMPFPSDDASKRASTMRRTARLMREGRSLVLFAEGILHRPPEVLPLGRALETIARRVPEVSVLPVAIHYDMSLHERPEAFIRCGSPIAEGPGLLERTREALIRELDQVRHDVAQGAPFETLAKGTLDVNERWDVRRTKRF
ncbi:MAG: 1-acyl-sn-glycerol-3-phosphate acyltransferase [Fimbriimonadaceae bacterium]|nr:1-acyl-sn-glycerol-3-phosphate acyltransferase [Fimbriimonadaceae bacterium]QYK57929.1 MAG: 1-acyl-sn-glycerol-3-phosphate acyltransferase [Fimbriimonadaceae bacterium]